MIRKIITTVHRYLGLGTAVFLVVAGLTGSILVFQDSLETRLAPELFGASSGTYKTPDSLLAEIQRQAAGTEVSFMMYPRESGRSLYALVSEYPTMQGEPPVNQIFVDPVSGTILGGRNSRNPAFSRTELIPWLYKLHYSLATGTTSSTGRTVLGVVALLWLVNCFAGFYLTLPRSAFSWRNWKPAWKIHRSRFNLDLHVAGGLWLWPILGVMAFTSVYFNLSAQVFVPIVKTFTSITTQPYQQPALPIPLTDPEMTWNEAVDMAEQELERKNVREKRLAYVGYRPERGYYLVGYHTEHSLTGSSVGVQIYVNAKNAGILQTRIVGAGTPGDSLIEWQFPLHSGQAFGWFGRFLVFAGGLFIAVLSITGPIIWWRKRTVRR